MVNINKGGFAELQKIKHIGKVRALLIINSRPFRDAYELSKIFGLGKIRTDEIIKQGLVKF